MANITHVFYGAGPPGTTPSGLGHHYTDTTNNDGYVSIHTASSAGWLKLGSGIGGGPEVSELDYLSLFIDDDEGSDVAMLATHKITKISLASGSSRVYNITLPEITLSNSYVELTLILQNTLSAGGSISTLNWLEFGGVNVGATSALNGLVTKFSEIVAATGNSQLVVKIHRGPGSSNYAMDPTNGSPWWYEIISENIT